jgi:beta-aspartyl-peptidase (threonine type)
MLAVAVAWLAACLGGCMSGTSAASTSPEPGATGRWAIVIHGGAGVIPRGVSEQEREEHLRSLRTALAEGADRLARGEAALDVVQAVVRILEDDPRFNAGRGAAFTSAGTHELDASIMDGRTRAAGAVAGVRTVRNPIVLARLVMERTPHVLLMGDGAERFADEMGVERVPNEWFSTPHRRRLLDQWRARQERRAEGGSSDIQTSGTVGAVALDVRGHLAAATSTGGMTGKRPGRVGDSPIIGAGTYASDASAAISGTGTGEQFIRHTVARDIAARVELAGQSLEDAARHVVFRVLRPDDGGIIGVGRDGSIVMVFSTEGMFRGAADHTGRFQVGIWDELVDGRR